MYYLANETKYLPNENYYSKSGDTYTLLVVNEDYTLNDNIPANTIYKKLEYDRIYISTTATGQKKEFPYKPNGVNNTIPELDAGQNDVDLDSYTNTSGKTIRNRVRHDVKTLDFTINTMSGEELKTILALRSPVWFYATFFDESEWTFVTKKMYCSSPKYHKYYIDKSNPLLNIYTSVSFGFVEE